MSKLNRELIKSILTIRSYEDNLTPFKEVLGEGIEIWMDGLIKSLFYIPNTKLLVICGENRKTVIENLLPKELVTEEGLYDSLILNFNFENKKDFIRLKNHNFIITTEPDKRLCSYVSVVEKWIWPQRKDVIVVDTTNIDVEKYLSINKLSLLRQLYKNFFTTWKRN